MVTAVVPPKLPMRQSNGVSAPATWAPQLLLLQTSLPYSLPFSVLSTGTAVRRVLPGIGCVGHRDGKVEQEDGKGAMKRSTLSQNQVSVSIMCTLQSLGKITPFHVGGICLNVEEKMDPLYKTPPPCVPRSYELN